MPSNVETLSIESSFTRDIPKSEKGLFEIGKKPTVTWNRKVPNTVLDEFKKIIEQKYNLKFDTYWDLHKWSIDNYIKFWEEVWHYFDVICSKPYDQVLKKTGDSFIDNDWFSGALFNFAENCLRIRDDSIAIEYIDEYLYEETITYAQLFEEVKLYSAALRKIGVQKGDRVAAFVSNRKEAFFIMLASASIGAIFGGPLPYYGAAAAGNIAKMMEPKVLFATDHHMDEGINTAMIDFLPIMVDGIDTLERVIVIPTMKETYKRDLSNIPNCVLLDDFLQEGRTPDGNVPDIIFEQLPFSHPICLNFTSGTTGLPKGPVHSAGTFISQLQDFAFVLNLRRGDVIITNYPVGWSIWDFFVPSFALGIKLVLLCGSPYVTYNGMNYWDLCGKYKVTYTFLVTSMTDKMEKMNMVPGPNTNLDSLKMIGIGGSPVKKENFAYLQNKVKKDLFIGSLYGSTEVFGTFSGFDLNMPAHGGEIQVPALGMDLKCFDEKGNSVVGQRGEFVICTPAPNFPIGLWKDTDNARLKSIYLTKFPGVWCHNDECWINPKTKGIVVIGRSDDTLKQKGERFGSGDIYFAIHSLEELQDYICVAQTKYNGDSRAVLFVKMKAGYPFTKEVRAKIEQKVYDELWEDCIPELILEVPEIPYNLNNKRMESVVRKIVESNKIPEVNNVKNPNSLKYYVDIPEVLSYNQE